MVFETGYGADYLYEDDYFKKQGAAIAERDELLAECDLLLLPKPIPEDLDKMKPRQVLFRWPHSVQQKAITQLASADIICNGILQDTNKPVIYVGKDEIPRLKPRSVIIDISCDEGMGFSFARPTTFKDPVFHVGEKITYYSVDHTLSYLWSAASREISIALIPYMGIVEAGERVGVQYDPQARHRYPQRRRTESKHPAFSKKKKDYPHDFE